MRRFAWVAAYALTATSARAAGYDCPQVQLDIKLD